MNGLPIPKDEIARLLKATPDPFNPANWMPNFDPKTGRRAIPAAAVPALVGVVPVWLYNEAWAKAGRSPWVLLTKAEFAPEPLRAKCYYLNWGPSSYKLVPPDFLSVFVDESAFVVNKAAIVASLKTAYDHLWKVCQAGGMTREGFDYRAELLRAARTRYEQETGL